jgi:hypothetical protein
VLEEVVIRVGSAKSSTHFDPAKLRRKLVRVEVVAGPRYLPFSRHSRTSRARIGMALAEPRSLIVTLISHRQPCGGRARINYAWLLRQ